MKNKWTTNGRQIENKWATNPGTLPEPCARSDKKKKTRSKCDDKKKEGTKDCPKNQLQNVRGKKTKHHVTITTLAQELSPSSRTGQALAKRYQGVKGKQCKAPRTPSDLHSQKRKPSRLPRLCPRPPATDHDKLSYQKKYKRNNEREERNQKMEAEKYRRIWQSDGSGKPGQQRRETARTHEP